MRHRDEVDVGRSGYMRCPGQSIRAGQDGIVGPNNDKLAAVPGNVIEVVVERWT